MNDERILRRPDVCEITGLKKTQIDELERRGEFPRRRRLSTRACGWLASEVTAWIEARPLAISTPPDIGGDPRHRVERQRKQHKQRKAARR